ncbi:MAG: HIT family protein [Candidatus Paceibacterota bacterium]
MNGCIFCDVVRENEPHHEIWWRNKNHIAFLDAAPSRPGHTLVIPNNHIENILDLYDEDYADLMGAVKEVGNKLRAFYKVPRLGIVVEGMAIAHVHVHLIPIRNKGDLGIFSQYGVKDGELSLLGEQLRLFLK